MDFDGITAALCHKLDAARLLVEPPALRAKLLGALSKTIGNRDDAVRALV